MDDPLQQVLILGLDGATWSLLRPWIEAGHLPALAQAVREGVSGDLHSTIPPYSAPAWVSFATGMRPGKHGVVDFWQPSLDDGTPKPISSQSIATPTFWDLLSRAGNRVAILNVPVTYPPHEVNGLLVSGMMTPDENAPWSYPLALKQEFLGRPGGYEVNPYATAAQSEAFLQRVLDWVPQRESVHRHFLEREQWALFANVVQASDPIQHHFWNCLDPSHPAYEPDNAKRYRALLQSCYAGMDAVLQDRLGRLDKRTALLVISDHGFGPAHKYVHVNRLLAEMNLLAFEERSGAGILQRSGISMSGLYRILRRLDPWNLRGRLSNRLRQTLRRQVDRTVAPSIEWSRTRAYAGRSSGESVYINLRGRDSHGIVEPGEAYEHLRDEIITALKALCDPETGQTVVEDAWRREEVYQGPQLSRLPDIVFRIGHRPYLPTDRLSVDALFEDIAPSVGGGRHQPEGILIAVGGPFRQGATIEGASIIDIAPTVLHLLGSPVPSDMDGRVIQDLFQPDYLAIHPVRHGSPIAAGEAADASSPYSEEEMDLITEHLRKLGYL